MSDRPHGTKREKINGEEYLVIHYYGRTLYRHISWIPEVKSLYTQDD